MGEGGLQGRGASDSKRGVDPSGGGHESMERAMVYGWKGDGMYCDWGVAAWIAFGSLPVI